ncbi:hypothetical protein QMN21_34645, partial [Serratia sp. Se-PFBMAAmG]|nr:hypothetical protein [Serratia sp. Se-PFBMAAmG]
VGSQVKASWQADCLLAGQKRVYQGNSGDIWMVNYDRKGVRESKLRLKSIDCLKKTVHLERQGRE